jgi:hypothetical protein
MMTDKRFNNIEYIIPILMNPFESKFPLNKIPNKIVTKINRNPKLSSLNLSPTMINQGINQTKTLISIPMDKLLQQMVKLLDG